MYTLFTMSNVILREREREFLKTVGNRDGWVTSSEISTALGVSVRTVKNYAGGIFNSFPGLLESSYLGYRILDRDLLARAMVYSIAPEIPQDSNNRRKFIVRCLLLEKNVCEFDELAYELCISPVTLTNELRLLKTSIKEFDLTIRTKEGMLFIDGPEENKKKLMSRLIYEDVYTPSMDMSAVQRYLPSYNLTQLKSIVTDVLKTQRYYMDDFSLLNLVIHIAITLERKRITDTASEKVTGDWESSCTAHISQIVAEIVTRIEKIHNVKFTRNEIHDFSLLIMTRVISYEINEVNTERLLEVVGDEVIKLVSLMQSQTKQVYNISITNEDFTVRFSLHLKNLLIRLRKGVVLRNPQMSDIKNSYPFVYDVSVFIANIFTQQTGFILSEDEIAYFALHLGVLIQERMAIKHEVRAIVLCPEYYGTSLKFANKLKAIFSENVLLLGIIADPSELRYYEDYDMVISTVPVDLHSSKTCITISSFLTNKDVLSLSAALEDILKQRTKAKVESKLRAIFKKELFFADGSIKNQKDAINTMGGALVENGYVEKCFVEKLFERERISSSAYLNIAIPHPLEMCALRTAIAVSLHKTPIIWGDKRVNIVFLLAININDKMFFKDIFDFITEVVSEEKKLRVLLETRSYEEFIKTLVSFAK